MEEWVRSMALRGAILIEAAAGILILAASLKAAVRTLLLAWIRGLGPRAADPIRLELGKTLALALEFLVGADILRTAVAPDWSQIGMLAAIVAIRTVLNYFLELERASMERAGTATPAKG